MTMPEAVQQASPAATAAQIALEEMFECIHTGQNFRLEAGAGAGKTFSLVQALRLIIDEQGAALQRSNQQVACITYTNVATDEIISRTDGHPAVRASTIHAFCWGLIKGFQAMLREKVAEIDAWSEKLEEAGGIGLRRINYDLGYRRIKNDILFIHHDDVLTLTVRMMGYPKFRQVLTGRFPIVFIDEYQDTNAAFADSIIDHFIAPGEGPLVGLFGDSWQKIYRDGKGLVEHVNLKEIGKQANFRSVPEVVNVLNAIHKTAETGDVAVFHTNTWAGDRRSGGHWGGDLPAEDAHAYLESLRDHLANEGWEFSPENTKILMLTHSVLAAEQSYSQILNAFQYNDSVMKKEDPHIAFLVDTLEPACEAFREGRFGDMFTAIGSRKVNIRSLEDKQLWANSMNELVNLCLNGTIGDVLDHLKQTHRPRLPDAVQRTEDELAKAMPEEMEDSRILKQINNLRSIPYAELTALAMFVKNHTPFSTKHGVKGAEFDNVLVVLGRGWNHYNWDQFLEWFPDQFPGNKADAYIRNRNLFYVSCSRARKRLVLLFTQELSEGALATLCSWFGEENVSPFTLA